MWLIAVIRSENYERYSWMLKLSPNPKKTDVWGRRLYKICIDFLNYIGIVNLNISGWGSVRPIILNMRMSFNLLGNYVTKSVTCCITWNMFEFLEQLFYVININKIYISDWQLSVRFIFHSYNIWHCWLLFIVYIISYF
jgi:hypothetical protein